MKSHLKFDYVAPPALFERFLYWCLPKSLKEALVGDLAEEFSQMARETTRRQANLWYMRQAALTSIQFLWKNKRGMLMFILGILAFVATFFMALLMSADISAYINVPSLIVVIPAAVFISIGIASRNTMKTGFRLLFDDELVVSIPEMKAAKHGFTVLGNSSMLLGYLGVIIGFVAISNHINAETFSKVIGPALAVSLLTLLYALFVKVLCYAAEQKIQHLLIKAE